MSDKLKAQQDWDEMLDLKLENKFAKSQGLAKKYFKNGAEFALNNLDKVPQVKELIDAGKAIAMSLIDASDINFRDRVHLISAWNAAIAKFKEGK